MRGCGNESSPTNKLAIFIKSLTSPIHAFFPSSIGKKKAIELMALKYLNKEDMD
jgi:hypothetical protein